MKSFTLIETLFVIIIVAIIFYLFNNIFYSPQQIINTSSSCLSYIYQQSNNFLNDSLKNKNIYDSDSDIFVSVKSYHINFDVSSQSISFSYTTGSDQQIHQTILLTGTSLCNNPNYSVSISGQNNIINIENQNISLSGNNFTGDIKFVSCTSENICQTIGSIHIDNRTRRFSKIDN